MPATRCLLLLAACVGGLACGADIPTATDGTIAASHNHGLELAVRIGAELGDEDDLTQAGMAATILMAVNGGEIAQAAFGLGTVTDDEIAGYAYELLIDHEAASVALITVVASHEISFVPSSVADELAADASSNLAILRSSPPGGIDFNFVEVQVRQHATALVVLDRLSIIIGDGDLGPILDDSTAMMQRHLARGAELLDTFY